MLSLQARRIFLALGITDMRKSIQGLATLAAQADEGRVLGGDVFAFCSRNRKLIKILYWDRNGFCLWQKKLECDHFCWPKEERELLEIGGRQLEWLLEGLDVSQAHARLEYCEK